MTIGVNFYSKTVVIEGVPIRLVLWDLAGQETFATVRPTFYRGAAGGLLVFDITRESTYHNLPNWLNEIYKHAGKIPLVLLGNKADLEQYRAVSSKEGEEFAKKIGCEYLETSALNGKNVEAAFELIAKKMLNVKKSMQG